MWLASCLRPLSPLPPRLPRPGGHVVVSKPLVGKVDVKMALSAMVRDNSHGLIVALIA